VVRERNLSTGLSSIREFVRARVESGDLDESASNAIFSLLSQFQQHFAREKDTAPTTIAALLQEVALDVFALGEAMLVRSTQLSAETGLGLNSFDNAILAAVLVRGAALHQAGNEVCFCTQDSDLQPWDKRGNPKDELSKLLEDAGIWVYGDFLLKEPPRPPSWPAA
jgi:hypothetical protein